MADKLSPITKGATASSIDISADIERFAELGILGTLLADRSTGGNIIWASNVFSDKGESYAPEDEIFARDITGENEGIIRTRASKDRDDQVALTRAHAEVFTPLWIVRKMVDRADEAWYEAHEPNPSLWQQYVRSPRLEITCGEAPYLVSRYDAADGTRIPVYRRCGVLDRKLMKVVKHTTTRRSWWRWVLRAVRSTYGYEYQGDNLLIARVNVLATLEDFCDTSGWEPFSPDEYRMLAEIISWNLWQMDGLTDRVPNGALGAQEEEFRLPGFDELLGTDGGQMEIGIARGRGTAKIFDWENGQEVEFQALKREVTLMDNGQRIKFDYIIGNPPYQEETADTSDKPIYHEFMTAAFDVAARAELITPARFLFNAGKTPKAWNKQMLTDRHFKVLEYYRNSRDVFPNNEIKGGIAITYRDSSADYGSIDVFIPEKKLRVILRKVKSTRGFKPLSSVVNATEHFKLCDVLYQEHPDLLTRTMIVRGKEVPLISRGHEYDLTSNILDKVSEIFSEAKPDDGNNYIRVYGRQNGKRACLYLREDYMRPNIGLASFKVVVAESNNNGTFGETLVAPFVADSDVATTQTFITMGFTPHKEEAQALLKFICGKFARAMLGTLKITQHNKRETWANVPLQDFTPNSDIDWTQSIAGIDQQLYAKYGLTQDEIDFIETHVKEMQ